MTVSAARKILAAIGVLGLGACTVESMPRPTIENLSAGDERIVFRAPAFSGAVHSMRFSDFWEEEEYALFQGAGAQAEILYAGVSAYDQLALEYGFTVARSVETWTFNKGVPKQWNDVQRVRTPLTEFFYKPYRLAGRNRQCFGFSGEWAHPADDPEIRPGKVIFGYYCAKEGEALGATDMARLLLGITLRGERHRIYGNAVLNASGEPPPTVSARQAVPGIKTGNPDFPFKFARHYQTSDGNLLD